LTVAIVGVVGGLLDSRNQSSLGTSRQLARARMIEKLKTKQVMRFDQPAEAMQFYWSKRSPNGDPVDISYVAVNRDNTDILYGEYTGKSLERSTDGGVNWVAIHGGVTEAAGNF
jgi:hypothetical protein